MPIQELPEEELPEKQFKEKRGEEKKEMRFASLSDADEHKDGRKDGRTREQDGRVARNIISYFC